MPKCPYNPKMTDEVSGIELDNPMFEIWHAGYEAHKLEMLQQSRRIELVLKQNLQYTIALAKSIQEVEMLKKELNQKLAERL